MHAIMQAIMRTVEPPITDPPTTSPKNYIMHVAIATLARIEITIIIYIEVRMQALLAIQKMMVQNW